MVFRAEEVRRRGIEPVLRDIAAKWGGGGGGMQVKMSSAFLNKQCTGRDTN